VEQGLPLPVEVGSIDHRRSLRGKFSLPAAWEVPVEIPTGISSEETSRTHVRVFGFHADSGEIVTDPNFEYFWKIMLTNNSGRLALRERSREFLDFVYNVVPKPPTFL
jgi:hypothetical protein